MSCAGFLTNRREVAASAGKADSCSEGTLLAGLWSEVGDDTPLVIEGTLTAILWDGRRRRLLLLRDRLGLHPLVYCERGDSVAVASEAAPVLALLGAAPTPNISSLVAYLHGYPPTPPDTFLTAVRSVSAGEWVEIGPRRIRHRKYWRLEPGRPLAEADCLETIHESLKSAVEAAVPRRGFTLALSGGLDTPSIAAILREARPRESLSAFTWRFDELPEADETYRAQQVSSQLDLDHHLLPADRWWPLSSPAGIETSIDSPVANFYRELWERTFEWWRNRGGRGIVTGAGGDHLFGFGSFGAYAYPDLLLTGRWFELIRQVWAHRRVSPASLVRILDVDLIRPLWHVARDAIGRDARVVSPSWLGDRARSIDWHPPLFEPAGRLLPGRRHRLRTLQHPSIGQLGVEMGRLAAVHGLELRHPMLDHRLFEVAARVPGTVNYRAGYHKMVLREAMRGSLPESVRKQRAKTVPIALFHRGIREHEQAKVWPLLYEMRAEDLGLVDGLRVRRSFQSYLDGEDDVSFWRAATLEDWLRRHF